MALSLAGRHAIWYRRYFMELTGITLTDPTLVLEDNRGAALWARNPVQHDRQRHIDICHHAIRDWQRARIVDVKYVTTKDQLADLFTKSLHSPAHARFGSILLGGLPAFMRTLQVSDIAVAEAARKLPITSWGGDAAGFPATVNWALLGTKAPFQK